MLSHTRFLVLAFLSCVLAGQSDPFEVSPEVKAFAWKSTANQTGTKAKLDALLRLTFAPADQGGLGIEYDASYTRSIAEVWRDRKANCLSLTAFYVGVCRSIGIDAQYAEALNTNRWRKAGNMTRFERHVVAVVHFASQFSDLVADFLPVARRRYGMYIVTIIPETRLKALYCSNRAVELLEGKKFDEAIAQAQKAVTIDPKLSVGWNTLGVVERSTGADAEAEAHYLKALSCDPKDVAALSNMESLLRERGRSEEAAKYRQLGLEVRKKDPYFHALLAEEALSEGNLEEAESQINEAIRIHYSEPEFYLFQARLRLLNGKLDGASKAIEKARKWAAPGEQERYDNKLEMLKRMKPQP